MPEADLRFLVPALACLGIALGLGAAALEHRWLGSGARRWSWTRACVVAVLMAAVVALLGIRYGIGVQLAAYTALAALLCAVALADLDTMTIPNQLVLAGIVLWAATVCFLPESPGPFDRGAAFTGVFEQGFVAVALDGLLGAVVVPGCLVIAAVLYEQVAKKQSFGGGDIKLLFMVGLHLGLAGSAFGLFFSCILGLAVAALWRRSRPHSRAQAPQGLQEPQEHQEAAHALHPSGSGLAAKPSQTFPFGPAIALATIITLLI